MVGDSDDSAPLLKKVYSVRRLASAWLALVLITLGYPTSGNHKQPEELR